MLKGLSTLMISQCRVTFKKNNEVFEATYSDEPSVLELALKNEIPVPTSCGGNGTCGTCRVFVENYVDKLPPKQGVELEMSVDRNFAENERLACQIEPRNGLVLRIPTE